MQRMFAVGVVMLLVVPALGLGQGEAGTAARVAAVAYVDVEPSASDAARTALVGYAAARRDDAGASSVEVFEQVGARGRFAVLETWRDETAFAARDPAAQAQLLEALARPRVSGYDERIYKALALGADRAADDRATLFVVTHVDVVPSSPAIPLLERLADASRGERGNLRFDVWQHAMRPNHFTVVEHWRDARDRDAHVAAPHARRYRDEIQPLTGSPLDERLYEKVNSSP